MVALDAKGNETSNIIAMMGYTWSEPLSTANPTLDDDFIGIRTAEAGFEEFKKLLATGDTINKIKEDHLRTREDFKDYETEYSPIEQIRNQNKIGRNELCSCGSGKKYKKCCLDS